MHDENRNVFVVWDCMLSGLDALYVCRKAFEIKLMPLDLYVYELEISLHVST